MSHPIIPSSMANTTPQGMNQRYLRPCSMAFCFDMNSVFVMAPGPTPAVSSTLAATMERWLPPQQ